MMRLSRFVVASVALLGASPAMAQPAPPPAPLSQQATARLVLCQDQSRPFDALSACTALIDATTTPPDAAAAARLARGRLHAMMRQYDRAIPDLTEALKLKPDLVLALVLRGLAYEASNQPAKALEDYDRAVQQAPNQPDGYAARGAYFGRKGDMDRVLADLDMALKLRPDDPATRLNRGAAFALRNDHAKAIADFDEAIRLQPTALAYYNRCTSRAITGALPEALADCNQALFLRSNFPEVLASRGLVYLRMRQPENAIRDYDLVVRVLPKPAAVLYGRGLAKLLMDDKPGAQTDMDAARKLDPAIEATFRRWGVGPG